MEKLFDLQVFAQENTQTTGGLSAEMKTYYGMELLDNAKPQLVHNQFAATKPLPTGGGKTVEWRKFGSFDKALTPLTEGVTPDGSGISVSYITKELAQYGDYTTVSDMLDLTAIDDVVLEITDRHGANMGLTLDTVTRNEIQQGKQVLYAPAIGADGSKTEVTARGALTAACRLTSEMVAKAATQLKKMNAPTFDGKYVCILHPSVAFDLRQDEAWIAAHQYAAATELFSGEIGELHGVRFVETTEAKIFRGEDLTQNGRTLLVNGKVENNAVVAFDGGTVAAGALAGRYVLLGGERRRVVSNTGSSMTLDSAVTAADNAVIYPGRGLCRIRLPVRRQGRLRRGGSQRRHGGHREAPWLLRHCRSAGSALQRGLEGRSRRCDPVRRVHRAGGVRLLLLRAGQGQLTKRSGKQRVRAVSPAPGGRKGAGRCRRK